MEWFIYIAVIGIPLFYYSVMSVEEHYKSKEKLLKFHEEWEASKAKALKAPKIWVETPPKKEKIITNFELETPEVHGWMQ